MNLTAQLAKHLRDVHFGGNWTWSNLKDQLSDVTWQEATTKVDSFNTILTLFYHSTYYVGVQLNVLKGGPLDAKDELSFRHPEVHSQEEWIALQQQAWDNAEQLAKLIEALPDSKLEEDFTEKKYGTYYRNIAGMIEHLHYHLGQIALLKQLVRKK